VLQGYLHVRGVHEGGESCQHLARPPIQPALPPLHQKVAVENILGLQITYEFLPEHEATFRQLTFAFENCDSAEEEDLFQEGGAIPNMNLPYRRYHASYSSRAPAAS